MSDDGDTLMSARRKWVAGVDGAGRDRRADQDRWVACLHPVGAPHEARLVALPRFGDILDWPEAPEIIVVDMPIGFEDGVDDGPGRAADRATRALLKPLRSSSVFPPPVRGAIVHAHDKAAAHDAQRAASGRAMSPLTAALLTKMAEIDALMTPALQARVREGHPELAFWALRGKSACAYSKKKASGLEERRAALAAAGYPETLLNTPRLKVERNTAKADDLLDACVLAWTAERILRGQAMRVPETPPCDARGLRMEIWC